MGLFDNLFKAKPDAADEAVVEAAKRISEHEKARLIEASRHSPATPAARPGIVPTAKPAPGVPAPRAYSPRTLGQVVTPGRAASRSGEPSGATTRKIRFTAHEEAARPTEVVLTVEDVLSRIPIDLISDESPDLSRELRFKVEDLSADIARGRAAVSLGSIAVQVPELFREPIARDDARQVRLPLQKLVEQIGFLPIKSASAPAPAPPAAALAPAAAVAPSLPPPPGPGPTVPMEHAVAPLEVETTSPPNARISLNLAAILRTCPRDLIVAELPHISEDDRISFPWPPIEKQLRTGLVEVSSVRFIFALPASLHGYFEAREGVRVPLPLDEIRKNMPGSEPAEEPASSSASAPTEPSSAVAWPTGGDTELPVAPVEAPVAEEERTVPDASVSAEPAPAQEHLAPPDDYDSIPVVVFARKKPSTPAEPVEPPVESAPPVEAAAVAEPVPLVEPPVEVEPAAVVEPAAPAPLEPAALVEKIEEPIIEPPAVEEPVVEATMVEQPAIEEAPAEVPVVEAPAAEVAPVEPLPVEAPAPEVSLVEESVVQAPVAAIPMVAATIDLTRALDLPPPLVAHAPPTLSVEPAGEPEVPPSLPIPTISEIEAPIEPIAPSEPIVPPIFVPPPLRQTGDVVAPDSSESPLAPPNVWMQPPPELAARTTSPWPPDVAPPPSPILPVRIIAPPVARPLVAPPPLFSGTSVEALAPAAIPASEPPPPPPPRPLDLDIARAALGLAGEATLQTIGSVLIGLPGLTACHLIVRHESGSAGELPTGFSPAAVRTLAAQLSTALDSSAESLGTGRVQHMTIFTDDGCVSFFTQGEATVCAIHRTRAFLPGVRERLTATVTALAHA